MKTKKHILVLFLITGLLTNCFSVRKSSGVSRYYGLYIGSTFEGGFFTEYLLIDKSQQAYYFLDSANYCKTPIAQFKEKYIAVGKFNIIQNSIVFAFDSCVETTSVGYVEVHGQTIEIKTKKFRKNYKQRFEGEMEGDKLSFKITTVDANNDTFKTKGLFIKCLDKK